MLIKRAFAAFDMLVEEMRRATVGTLRPRLAYAPGSTGRLASQESQSGGKTKVRARRRRPRGRSEPGERDRAEAPRRRRDDAGKGPAPPDKPPPPSGGRPRIPLGRPSRPSGGGPRIPLVGVALLGVVFVCVFVVFLILSPSEPGDDYVLDVPTEAVDSSQPIAQAPPTNTPQPFTPPPRSSGEQTWLVMLYQDADDKILEQDIYIDLNEAERVGSSDRLHIVAQVDRFRKGYQGDGDWASTKRFYITQDQDLERVRSQEVADLGEVNMADGDTLVDFATWAIETFPADKHVLILSDHGMGWPGGWTDPAPGGRGDDNVALADMGDELFLMEMDEALEQIRTQTGLEKFELIGLDACLMGHVEVFSALSPHARYAVASQETEPALGWAYTAFLRALQENPDMDGADLGRLIVQSYVRQDERIVDDEARGRFLGQGSSLGGLFGTLGGTTAEQLARQMEDDITLTAIDLAAMPALMDSLNELSFALTEIRQPIVAAARTYAQSFTSVFGKNVPPSYIDLANFSQLLKRESGSDSIAQATDRLLAALGQAIVAERHGHKKPGASGVSIYFPNSQLYGSRFTGPESYTTVAHRFASESLWDDFLAYHYTGRPFEPAAGEIAVPSRTATISGPGSGTIEVAPITLSSSVAAPGQPVLLSTEIRGQNIGHIYLFVGYLDRELNSIFVADTDYLESGETREIGGVYYPSWGEGEVISLEFEWEPIMYALNDGVQSALALFAPEDYGALPEEAVYTVEGTYTFADGSGTRHARLYFSNGVLKQVYGFTGQDATGAPREILPEPGDTFTVLEQWIDLGAGEGAVQYATQPGGTVTFGGEVLAWEELDAAPGEYVVGFIVEDLDGNAFKAYEMVTVAE
jgi:hypothetical protein